MELVTTSIAFPLFASVISVMLFDLNDIDYLVVPREFQARAEQLVDGLRAVIKIYEDEIN